MSSSISIIVCISAVLLSLLTINSFSSVVEARRPNEFHQSPSGDCEKVTYSGDLPRCPDGYHRIPDGDCEQVSSGDTNNDESSKSDDDDNDDDKESEANISFSNTGTLTNTNDCKGSAYAFIG